MNFKFSTNFLLPYARRSVKYWGPGSTGLDVTPIVPIHTGRPVLKPNYLRCNVLCQHFLTKVEIQVQNCNGVLNRPVTYLTCMELAF